MSTFARVVVLAFGLTLSSALSEATAQSHLASWLGYMPLQGGVLRIDRDRNGIADLVLYDTNHDGRGEAMRVDTDLDGWLEGVALDADRDGIFTEFFIDEDRDTRYDIALIDRNRDGRMGEGDVMAFDTEHDGIYQRWLSLDENGSVDDALAQQPLETEMNRQAIAEVFKNQAKASALSTGTYKPKY